MIDIENYLNERTKEECFVAFLGLPQGKLTSENVLNYHQDIREKYNLDSKRIKMIVDKKEKGNFE